MSGGTVQPSRVALFAIAHGVDDSYQGAVPALLPFFVAERHYSYAAATSLVLALTMLSSAIQPVFGSLTDRLHLDWLVPGGLTVAGIGVGLSGLTGSYPLTFAAIALAGIGVAAFHPEAARGARAASADSQQAMSFFSVGGNVGYAVGPLLVLGALLVLPGTSGTILLAVPAAVTGVVVLHLLRGSRFASTRQPGRERSRHGADDVRSFVGLTALVMLRSVVYFGLTALVALYVGTELKGGKALGEVSLTTLVGCGALGTITGGRLADRFGRLPVTRISLAVSLVTLSAVALAPLPWTFLPVAATGFVLFQSFSLTVTLGQDYLPTRIGTSSGVTLGLAITVGGITAPALGALADATSLRLSILTLLAFLPVALGVALRLHDPRRASSGSPGRAEPAAGGVALPSHDG